MSRKQNYPLVLFIALVGLSGCAVAPKAAIPTETPDIASAIKAAAEAETSVVNVTAPAPCCKRQTLPQFLGITGALGVACEVVDRIRNRLGAIYPGLEAKPELLAITDPANMTEDAPPAVKAAAEIKAQEDQAAQKIKALRYLATIGCGGCYPEVEDALIAAMEDCTEAVRYEAVVAVRDTTCKKCCFCAQNACCTEKIQNKLRELSSDGSDDCCGGTPCCDTGACQGSGGCCGSCCNGEPSARVRRIARLALQECGPPVIYEEPPEPEEADGPSEGPDEGGNEDDQNGPEEIPEGESPNNSGDPIASARPQRSASTLGGIAGGVPFLDAPGAHGMAPRTLPPVYDR